MSIPPTKNSTKTIENIIKKIIAANPKDDLSLMRANRAVCREYKLTPSRK